MTSSGLEPATCWLIAQCLNQLRYYTEPVHHRKYGNKTQTNSASLLSFWRASEQDSDNNGWCKWVRSEFVWPVSLQIRTLKDKSEWFLSRIISRSCLLSGLNNWTDDYVYFCIFYSFPFFPPPPQIVKLIKQSELTINSTHNFIIKLLTSS
jgi:hypothetical protein